ncbi:hypothetical protein ZIOFF_031978 [Zingiber officinale]|uniref:WAT1-related protein n=1 Tax=Zingiber officinale TaxID=94328 RepID=A0A8J5GFY8_ZINOF|nr:hypothetical protein ZIOFF_031978 [Zingiber officinale]
MASVKACAPYFYMIVSQFAYAGSSILGKLALGQGLSALVFVVYRHLIAMLILAPLAYVPERNRRPSFSFGVMLKIFILAMLGITIQQNVYYVGLHLISPTVASALGNVIPAFTFLLAIVLSPEKGDAWLKGSALMLFGYFACSVSLVLQVAQKELADYKANEDARFEMRQKAFFKSPAFLAPISDFVLNGMDFILKEGVDQLKELKLVVADPPPSFPDHRRILKNHPPNFYPQFL